MKQKFIQYELSVLTINAALATRDKLFPIYSAPIHKRTLFKDGLSNILSQISAETDYVNGVVSSKDHIDKIKKVTDQLTGQFFNILHQEKLRFGVCQKAINLHLKYMWCIGVIKEPPHCPIDGKIRDLAKLNYDWTRSDSIKDYENAIADLRLVVAKAGQSLSEWELENFERTRQ